MDVSSYILYEDDEIIVCRKPAGMAVQHRGSGTMDLESLLINYLSQRRSPGMPGRYAAPYLAVVHRLDQPVEGVMVFAKTKKAAADLSAQVQNGKMKKEYLAVVRCPSESRPYASDAQGKDGQSRKFPEKTAWYPLTDYLIRDRKTNTSRIVPAGTKDAKEARLSFRILRNEISIHGAQGGRIPEMNPSEHSAAADAAEGLLLQVRLFTGRHHQIRVQLAGAGMPIVGDRKYGEQMGGNFAGMPLCLAAWRLEFYHPASGKRMSFEAVPSFLPPDFL